jgi:PAS domain S-box-containing protein
MSRDGIRGIVRALAQPVTYLGVAMLVFVYCAIAYLLIVDRKDDFNDALHDGENLARIFDQSFLHIFKSVDATLLFIRKSYQQNPAEFDLATWVRDASIRNKLTFDFAILDSNGRIVDTSYSKNIIGADRSYLESFRVSANLATDQLFISKPYRTTGSGRWAISLARRMTAADGTFAGVVMALLDPSELGNYITRVNLGPGGAFALVSFDGIMYTRVADGAVVSGSIGQKLPLRTSILNHLGPDKRGHYWNVPGVIDSVSRLISYRTIEFYPLTAVIGVAEAEVYRHSNENARIYLGIALILTVGILCAIYWGAIRERKLIETTSQMQQAKDSLVQANQELETRVSERTADLEKEVRDRKEAQIALTRSQERYALVEKAVNDGIWDWNILTDEDYLSPRWKGILGFADDELPNTASSFFERIHPDDKAVVAEAVRTHLEENKPYDLDLRLRRKNGDYCWVRTRGRALCDAANRPVRMLGTITDISERKQAEALVEESRSNLARAETMALLGHYKFENESNKLIWSAGVYRIFGKSPESFTPTLSNSLELIHPDDRPALKQYHLDVIAGIDVFRKTLRATKHDGQAIYIEFWSTPIRAIDGGIAGMFGTLQDVTVRKQAEEALAQANEQLEKRVTERTAELAEEMRRREEAQMTLIQVQKMEAVGQLTAGIAHDFNNLLAVIQGSLSFVDAAASHGLTAEAELIDAALRATRRGRDLIQRLLAFSRQVPLRAELTAVDQLVLDTLRLLQRTLGEGIEIVPRLDAAAAIISVDRNQLANALLNLALNARDAMLEGGRLTIATMRKPAKWAATEGPARWPTGEEVCITVSDTGVGMTEDVRQRVLEPFFTTKTHGLGTGLGLSMVHGFVEQSGGHIEIDSTEGTGTTITIHLPRINPANQTGEAETAAGPSPTGNEKTVLLVEDDPDVRIVTAAQLKQLGYKVHAVANGMEAIDAITSPATIDITLTDLVLPGSIDGVTLVKEAMLARPGMGVLCMSGYDPTQKHRKWLEIQNIQFLEKPFSIGQLTQALAAALANNI